MKKSMIVTRTRLYLLLSFVPTVSLLSAITLNTLAKIKDLSNYMYSYIITKMLDWIYGSLNCWGFFVIDKWK